ncbi:MAG: M48 family metallopeptidase [Candidatus Omnitrophica bacterium]|nr:M48 family metallopeptidase [Candidatus Omnitrophota bacterium]
MDATEQSSADARRYARIRYRLMLIELGGWLVFLLGYQASGLSVLVAGQALAWTPVEALQLAAYLAAFGACAYLVFLPLHLYGSFFLEHRFGLSRLTWLRWCIRELKQVALSAAFSLFLFEGLYALLRAAPATWPLWATLGWLLVSVGLARIFPTWLLPLFYKTSRLTDDALVQRLLALCERARLSVLGVFRVNLGVETRKANAALAGFGHTRRVLVSDTLLERFEPEEIETVLAHELGHQHHRHITKLLFLSAAGSFLAFSLVQMFASRGMIALGFDGLTDLAGFPLLLLALWAIGLVGLPLQQAISRAFEWQADRFAVHLSGKPSAFAGALRKLGELNLADPAPPKWVEWLFYDHPPLPQRIRAAETAVVSS